MTIKRDYKPVHLGVHVCQIELFKVESLHVVGGYEFGPNYDSVYLFHFLVVTRLGCSLNVL